MHILYIFQFFGKEDGAFSLRAYANARRLIEKGHRVTMVCGTDDRGVSGLTGPFVNGRREGIVDGIYVIQFEGAYSNKLGFFDRIRQFARFTWNALKVAMTLDYDLIFTSSAPLSVAIPGIFAKWFRGKKFVFEARDLWPETPIAMGVIRSPLIISIAMWLERLAYRTAHRCIGLSPGGVDGIRKYGRISQDRVAMISNAADKAFIDKISPRRPDEFPSAESENGVLLAIYAGAHGPANGLDAVIEVGRWLKAHERNDIRILLMGTGKEKARLQSIVTAEELSSVVFYDSRPKPEALAIVKAADVGLMLFKNVPAFYYGTSPNKFFDYISAGVPVLCNYPGWVSEMIREDGAGVPVAPDNPAAFAQALIYLKENPEARKQCALNTQKLVPQFDRDKLADDFANWITAA